MSASDSIQSDFAPGVANPGGQSPVLLVCEHASNAMPPSFGGLGLGAEALRSHIAWDPGALDTATHMAGLLDAALIHSRVSRLIYDCNRPPEAPDAMPPKSEATVVPGNADLSEAERATRTDAYYRPFETLLSDTLDQRGGAAVLVTIHSFTPVYHGVPRAVEIGILHDTDARLADAMLDAATGYRVERNAPYGPEHGVTHTLRRHALPRGLLNVMIEVRNDLLTSPQDCADMAKTLSGWVTKGLESLAGREAT